MYCKKKNTRFNVCCNVKCYVKIDKVGFGVVKCIWDSKANASSLSVCDSG